MKVTLKKVTIVAERLLKDKLVDLIRAEGATGYTLTAVEGECSRGVRASDWEGRNLQIVTIVSPAVADAILNRLSAEYFKDFAVIAWLEDVQVLRGSKFVSDSDA
jgi:nitrogen regulatory protein P-II 2